MAEEMPAVPPYLGTIGTPAPKLPAYKRGPDLPGHPGIPAWEVDPPQVVACAVCGRTTQVGSVHGTNTVPVADDAPANTVEGDGRRIICGKCAADGGRT